MHVVKILLSVPAVIVLTCNTEHHQHRCWMAGHYVGHICRREKFYSTMSLICEVAIIASTFIFLRNEIAWQKWLIHAGHSGSSRDKMAMLIFSLVATACVIFLTIIGRGNTMSGCSNAWRIVTKVSELATSIDPTTLPHLRIFKASIHPLGKDVHPKQDEQAAAEGLHGLKSTAAMSV
jgi:hypothetical protein